MSALFAAMLLEAFASGQSGRFEGRWDLTSVGTHGQDSGWLEVGGDGTTPAVLMVGRVGGAKKPERAEIRNGVLHLRTKDWFGKYEQVEYVLSREGDRLKGLIRRETGGELLVTGLRAPALERAGRIRWDKPINLLESPGGGWSEWLRRPADNWRLENGEIVNTAKGPNIRTRREFIDFRLHIEFRCPERCNSGIYLRGRYEVAIDGDPATSGASHQTGAIYGFLGPRQRPLFKPDQLQALDITLAGRRVTVVLDGETLLENAEIPGPTGGAIDSHEELPGPIMLQGDHGPVAFRAITVTPAAESR
jgi:hypothetical protein